MRLGKTQSRILAAGVVTIFLVIAISLVPSGTGTITPPRAIPSPTGTPRYAPIAAVSLQPSDTPQTSTSTTPASAFSLGSFHRSENKDGKVLWEISATAGDYSPGAGTAQLTGPVMHLYRPTGEKIAVTAERATLYLTEASLSSADLEGSVVITYNDTSKITSAQAIYSKETNEIRMPQDVLVTTELLTIQGASLVAYLDTKKVEIFDPVHTVIAARKLTRSKGGKK